MAEGPVQERTQRCEGRRQEWLTPRPPRHIDLRLEATRCIHPACASGRQDIGTLAHLAHESAACATVQTRHDRRVQVRPEEHKESTMYIGGGILGTILVIALIVFLVRRV
jgi:hypothetical protein